MQVVSLLSSLTLKFEFILIPARLNKVCEKKKKLTYFREWEILNLLGGGLVTLILAMERSRLGLIILSWKKLTT